MGAPEGTIEEESGTISKTISTSERTKRRQVPCTQGDMRKDAKATDLLVGVDGIESGYEERRKGPWPVFLSEELLFMTPRVHFLIRVWTPVSGRGIDKKKWRSAMSFYVR